MFDLIMYACFGTIVICTAALMAVATFLFLYELVTKPRE